MRCPLCGTGGPNPFHEDRARQYLQCTRCSLVFVPPDQQVDAAAERARYDQHRNQPDDIAYRAFLSRLATPLLERLRPGSHGLDFGCGPGPALAQMLTEAGMSMRLYDPFYVPDETVWEERYDFITASEVIEHLRAPEPELDRLFGALRPGGWLAVMTRWVGDVAAFAGSRYTRDPTHICFYSPATFHWIADRWHAAAILSAAENVALLQVPSATSGRDSDAP